LIGLRDPDRHHQLETASTSGAPPGRVAKEEAELWAKYIRESIPEIETQISTLIEAIEKYLR
jgi:hypothetical protein